MKLHSKISIVIPAYNAEKYISKCLDSVINQTYTNIEVIVINDGSSDGTSCMLDNYENRDKRIQVIHQKNKGQSATRNVAMSLSTGDYIMFLDSDDWLELDCCEKALTVLLSNNADIVIFEYYKEYKNKSINHITYSKSNLVNTKVGLKEFFLYDMRTITVWGKLYSAQCITQHKFDTSMKIAEDVDFNYRVYGTADKIIYINELLLHYRILDKSAIHGYDNQIINKFEYPLSCLKQYMVIESVENDKAVAYYSFLAIAYLLICQNGIFLNNEESNWIKCKKIKELNQKSYSKDLFKNVSKINVPITKKALIYFGKFGFYFGILSVLYIKKKVESIR